MLAACAVPPPPRQATPAAANDQTIVALDEFAGLAALTLGVKPASVFLTFGYTTAKAIFESAGVPTTPGGGDGVNLEAVAALKPKNIIGVSLPTTVAVLDKLKVIAQTTVVEYTASWQDQLKVMGDALGRATTVTQITSKIETAITTLKNDLAVAGKAGQTVSVVGALDKDLFALAKTGLVGSILVQLGLKRPAAQAIETEATNPFIPINAEKLEDHDADTILVLSGGAYQANALTSLALWPRLLAVQNKRVINVLAEIWFASNAFGADWIVRDMRAALLGTGEIASEGDVLRRWQAFTSG
jgi:iron complex transport system substrate-binding protein